MTKQEDLRRWLNENGYAQCAERLVQDKDYLYPIFTVYGGPQPPLSVAEIYGGVDIEVDPLAREYLTPVSYTHLVDCTHIADHEVGNGKTANMVMLGAIIRASGVVSLEIMDKVLAKTMTGKKEKLIPANTTALSAWKA